ncbi:hypothetical protein LK542_00190 [Massilia sp. IC2-477]|uniref:hypothetical protein n=1 Tax=Massilia sp. IC2-477 TaxID=2887198 RepID=UPI001D12ECFC|nr:hypothetical protein [Massilia sp. IC2-477]MCC2954028.1 hypothetical protein [Massilia sp. IC2-477]
MLISRAATCALFLTLGASSAAQDAAPEQTVRSTARIRLFGQNGVLVDFYQNSNCVGGNAQKTRVSGGAGDAFSSLFGRARNTSIGMKDTPNTENLFRRDGVASKAYFREYEIPADQPVSLRMAFQSGPGVGVRCSNLGGTFTPAAGKDYEVALERQSGQCVAVVQEIRQDEAGKVTMQDVQTAPTADCK